MACAALLLPSCGRGEPPGPRDEAPPRAGAPRAASAAGQEESSGAAAAPLSPAAGGEVVSAATVTECPETLEGAESVNRVITRACGVVTVSADYHVNNGSLTLEAGATLAFREGVTLNVGYNDSAKLIVRGTDEEPVRFISAGDRVPGFWRGVRLHSHADRSVLDRLVIEHAGEGGIEALRVDAQDVVITRVTVRGAKGSGVTFGRHGTTAGFSGNRFERIGRWPVSLGPEAAGGIDGESQFEPGAVVHVYGGTITGETTWRPAGAPYHVSEDVHVEGEEGAPGALFLAAGVEVRFAPEARLAIGYSSPALLRVNGVAFAPVVLRGSREPRAASWPGVVVHALGEASFSSTIFEHGGDPASVGVLRVDGTVSVIGCTFRDNVGGVALGPRARVKVFDGNAFDGNAKGAVALHPPQFDMLGPANRYGEGERIVLHAGTVEDTATWRAQGALVEVLGDLLVDGRTVLTVEPGARFAFKDKASLSVGQRDNASLRLLGVPGRPIELLGLRDEPAAWAGVRLEESSRDSVLAHVIVRAAAAGVTVAGDANAEIHDLLCLRCSGPALAVACTARVTAASVTVAGGPFPAEARAACP